MIQKSLWRAVLVVALSAALATPARADSQQSTADNIIVGVVATVAAIVVVTIILVRHQARKDRTIIGCISSSGNGMTIADENDRQVYELAGDTIGITAGERMKLKGKKVSSKGTDHSHVWVATKVIYDYGACQP